MNLALVPPPTHLLEALLHIYCSNVIFFVYSDNIYVLRTYQCIGSCSIMPETILFGCMLSAYAGVLRSAYIKITYNI